MKSHVLGCRRVRREGQGRNFKHLAPARCEQKRTNVTRLSPNFFALRFFSRSEHRFHRRVDRCRTPVLAPGKEVSIDSQGDRRVCVAEPFADPHHVDALVDQMARVGVSEPVKAHREADRRGGILPRLAERARGLRRAVEPRKL